MQQRQTYSRTFAFGAFKTYPMGGIHFCALFFGNDILTSEFRMDLFSTLALPSVHLGPLLQFFFRALRIVR